MQRHLLLPIVGVLSGCGARPELQATVAAGGSPQVLSSQIDALVPVVLDETLVPGAVVGVIHNRRVVYERTFGYADVARKQPVTASTRFNVASISKTVIAWTAMALVETGRLELDTPQRVCTTPATHSTRTSSTRRAMHCCAVSGLLPLPHRAGCRRTGLA